MIKNLRMMLLAVLTILCGSAMAQVSSAAFSEDFENLTITDADSYGYGTKLSNGWAIVGGQVSKGDYTAYTLGGKIGESYIGKNQSKGLAGLYGSSNSAFILTNEVSGKVTLNVANYGTSAASICIYEAEANGDSYTKGSTVLYNKTWNKDTYRRNPVWEEAEIEIGETAKRLAIVMVRACMDDFLATNGEDIVVPVKKSNLTITNANPAETVDLTKGGTTYVSLKNSGSGDATNAKLTLYVDNEVNNVAEIGTVAAGKSGFKSISYDVTKIEAGEHQVYITLTADNDEGDGVKQTESKTVNFTMPVPEATFQLTAQPVNIQLPAENMTVVVNVKNTSEVEATNVDIKLWINGVVGTQTIASLAGGAAQDVTFEVANPFQTEGTYEIQALTADNKYGCYIKVNVAAAPVEEIIDMELTTIMGISEIDLTTENKIQVWYKNNSNVDVENAVITVTLNDAEIARNTVTLAKGQNGNFYVTIPTENLTAGVDATVVATVSVENDTNAENDTFTKTYQVKGAAAPEATFSLTAENVTVAYDATSYDIVAKVKNTSEVDAANVAVNLVASSIIATDTIESLPAGQEQEVTFTITGGPFTGDQEYQIWIGNGTKGSTSVKVTIEAAPVTPVIDIALIQFSGLSEINLAGENTIQVWFENNSNVDVENATITLKLNDNEVGTQTIAKNENYKLFALPTEGLEAGQEATIVATLKAENNKEGNLTELTKTLPIVGGEVEPAADIALNPISSWEVEAGEQEISVSVAVFNNGNADAENVKIDLYRNYPDILVSDTIEKLEAGKSTFVTMKFNYNFEEGNEYKFTVQTLFKDATPNDNMQEFTIGCKAPVADLTIEKIAPIKATTEDSLMVNATVKNLSDIAAKDVKVALYHGMELVSIVQTIDELAANGDTTLVFTIGKLAVGEYSYNVQITSKDANADNNMQDFTVKVSEPIEQKIEVALTQIQGSSIDLAAESNLVSVWLANNGTIDADAVINAQLNETALEAQTINVKAGKNGFASFTLPTEGLVAGQKATLVATIAVEGNTSEATTLTKELDIVNSSIATEPVFQLSAQDVEMEFGTEKFDVVVTVKNTSNVNAEKVAVNLFHNSVIATDTIASLAAGAETTITFADVENPYTKAGTYAMQVLTGDNKYSCDVNITMKEAPVEERIEVAMTAIQGISQIDLAAESNTITVWVENTGNVDADAVFDVKLNETALEAQTVNVKAGKNGYATFALPTEGLVVGEKATVIATVTVENNTSDNITITKEYDVVNNGTITEPVFALTAQPVEVQLPAEKINILVNVKNSSNIAATDVALELWHNDVIATDTIKSLAGGESKDVTFSIDVLAAGTYRMQVLTADHKYGCDVNVIVKDTIPTQTVDLAVTAISGTLSLDIETNYLTVFVENMGNVDVTDAVVSLYAGVEELGIGTISIKAGKSGFKSFAVAAEKLQAGEFIVTAKVTVNDDVEPSNNELSKTYTIVAPMPTMSFNAVANVLTGTSQYEVTVTVKNESADIDAENVVVKIYYEGGELFGTDSIAKIAAGTEEKIVFSGTSEKTLTESSQVQVFVTGADEAKWIHFNIVESLSVKSIKAVTGNERTVIYTLSGKKVNAIQKGSVYIINGKKVMIK